MRCFRQHLDMSAKKPGNSEKKNLIQYRFKTYTIIYCALGPNFCKKMKLGGRPHWGPQKLLFDKKVAEMSSFHHLKVYPGTALKIMTF